MVQADRPLSVFVVDDEPAVRSLLSRILQRHGFEIRSFRTADEARLALTQAALSRAPVDAVLLDMRLDTESNSTEDAEALLQTITGRMPQPEVVVMSGHLSSDEFLHLVMKGASDFITKPWDARELVRRVRDCATTGRQKYLHHHALGGGAARSRRDAFLSYSSRNADLAQGLRRVLERMGVSTWYAPNDIVPGEHWPDSLDDAIHKCSVFLVLLTADAIESEHVITEVRKALARREMEPQDFLLIPITYGMPVHQLPERLRALQSVDFSDRQTFVDNVVRLADRISQFVESHCAAAEERRVVERRGAGERRRSATIALSASA